MTRSVEEHRREAPASVRCMVVTVSDTRTKETDKSGALICRLLENDDRYEVAEYHIVRDEYEHIRELLLTASSSAHVDAVLLNGGTGIAAGTRPMKRCAACWTKGWTVSGKFSVI